MKAAILLLSGAALTGVRGQAPCIAASLTERLLGPSWTTDMPAMQHLSIRGEDPEIPVVFHVVWHSPEENVPASVLSAMLDRLNADLSATNTDLAHVREPFVGTVGAPGIQLCLASEDPAGLPTNGIVRRPTGRTWFDPATATDDMKAPPDGSPAWDPTRYLNIWICDIASGAPAGAAMEGYAYIAAPGVVGLWSDGVVLDVFHALQPMSRTPTHEVGHYLGLLHPWGDGGCGSEDLVDDTPMTDAPTFSCADPQLLRCGQLTQYENFMDHAACRVMFTQGQSERMNSVLAAWRPGLLAVAGCGSGTSVEEAGVPDATIAVVLSAAHLWIRWNGPAELVRVIDAQGRTVRSTRPMGEACAFPVQGLAPGVHLAQVRRADHWSSLRFLVGQ